jgi:hypothetical protein
VVLLAGEGQPERRVMLEENQATLVPQGAWHRLAIDEPCRYLFLGGGRTEIRRGGWTSG